MVVRRFYMNRSIAAGIIASCICIGAYAQADAALPREDIPAGSMMQQRLAPVPAGKKGFTVIMSEIVPYPASWRTLPAGERQLRLFNILSRISTQKGITYISRRAGYKPKVLFEESRYIDMMSGGSNGTAADPVCTELPLYAERFAEQKDTTFGDNVYRHRYTNTGDETFLEVTNCTAMKYHGITCIAADELTTYMSVMQTEQGIVLTAAATVVNHDRNIRVLLMNVDIADSFSRRADALCAWYCAQLDAEG